MNPFVRCIGFDLDEWLRHPLVAGSSLKRRLWADDGDRCHCPGCRETTATAAVLLYWSRPAHPGDRAEVAYGLCAACTARAGSDRSFRRRLKARVAAIVQEETEKC